MPAKTSLTLQFSTRETDCGGVKLWVPEQAVDPGEVVRVFLWESGQGDLDGYTLTQGADNLGTGTVLSLPGQVEHRIFHLNGDRSPQKFDWPITAVTRVLALGHLLQVVDGFPAVVAAPGTDVTRYFQRSGPRCLGHIYGAPNLIGSVQAWAARSPWCRVWEWTVPEHPDTDFTWDGCLPESQREDAAPGDCWFFLMRYGILQEEFSLELSDTRPVAFEDFEQWEVIENQAGLKRLSVEETQATYTDNISKSTMGTLMTDALGDQTCAELGID